MRPTLILDKSFLDGAPTVLLRQLCMEYRVICSETLFFELMTTGVASQRRCFAKLPDTPGSFCLLPDIPPLLRAEVKTGAPCGDLGRYVLQGAHVFNSNLASGDYQAPTEIVKALTEWQEDVRKDTLSFLGRCQSVHQFFPELIGIEYRDFPSAVADARARVGFDEELTRAVFTTFRPNHLPANAPTSSTLDPRWAWFRWIQCQLVAALRIFERYQCNVPTEPSAGILERAEHCMHDARYVTLAALADAIASNDDEIIQDVRLVAPKVSIISTTSQ